MASEWGRVEAGAGQDGFGDHELAVEVLGGLLQASRHVHRVADRGEVRAVAVAHAAHDGVADVDADAQAQGLNELAAELLAQGVQSRDHAARRGERLAAAGLRPSLHAEERHRAVTGELVGDAAGALDRRAHRLEVTVEEVDDVVGQPALGHSREAPQIGEEHGDLLLDALALDAEVGREGVAGGQERDDVRLACGAELARQPDVRAARRCGAGRAAPPRSPRAACRGRARCGRGTSSTVPGRRRRTRAEGRRDGSPRGPRSRWAPSPRGRPGTRS